MDTFHVGVIKESADNFILLDTQHFKYTEQKYKRNTFVFAAILEWSFVVISQRHTCVLIIPFNQHPEMPHLSEGWITMVSAH